MVSRFKKFLKSSSGNVAIIFGMALLPVAAMTGAAVDYSRSYNIQNRLQSAADAAVLAATRNSAKSLQQRKKIADKTFYANLGDIPAGVTVGYTLTEVGAGHKMYATAEVDTAFMELVGIDKMSVGADASAIAPQLDLEVVLVLDTTGSMAAQDKIGKLKKAAHNFLKTMEEVGKVPGKSVKVGVVPFSNSVRLDTKEFGDKDYIKVKTSFWLPWKKKSNWTGCLQDRPLPYDADDTAPTLTNSLTLFEPVGVKLGFNNWDKSGFKSSECKVRPIQPLTTEFGDLRSTINNLAADGNTNLGLGMSWGMKVLSPGEPFTEGAAMNDDKVVKIMVVLTDGENTQSRWSFDSFEIDKRTKKTCDDIHSSGVDLVYMIRLVDGNAELLEYCASSSAEFLDITDPSQLDATFNHVASDIVNRKLRLTM